MLTDDEGRQLFYYNALRARIKEKFGSFNEFAKHIGVSQKTMSFKLTGKCGLSQDDMITWGMLLDIPLEEFGLYFFT